MKGLMLLVVSAVLALAACGSKAAEAPAGGTTVKPDTVKVAGDTAKSP